MGQLNEQVVSARKLYVCVLQATSSCPQIGNNAWEWSYGKHDEQEFTGLNIVLDGNYIRRNFLDCNNPGCDFLGGKFPGGNFSGGNYPVWEFSR